MGAKSLNVYIESITLKAIRSVLEKNIQFTDSLCVCVCDVTATMKKNDNDNNKNSDSERTFLSQNFCK